MQQGDAHRGGVYRGPYNNAAIVLDSGLGVPTQINTSTGILFKNAFTVGIDMGTNDIHMHQGRRLYFAKENDTYFAVDTDGYLYMWRNGVRVKQIG